MVCLSKSLGGGLPISLVMMRPELDVWKPGQHTGTFRGNNLAFVAGRTLLDHFWSDGTLSDQIKVNEQTIRLSLESLAAKYPDAVTAVRGRGMIWGIEMKPNELAVQISRKAFELGLVIETCGPEDQVVKLLPPLIVNPAELDFGLQLLNHAFAKVLNRESGIGELSSESTSTTNVTAQDWNPSMAEQSIDVLSNLTDELVGQTTIEATYMAQHNQIVCDAVTQDSDLETYPDDDSNTPADVVVGNGAVFVPEELWIEEIMLPINR
jgi:hypothetical protein